MKLNDALKTFSHSIVGADSIVVKTQPEPWARIGYCFANVKEKIDKSGGSSQLGWMFLHYPVQATLGFLEANHHEVWRSPEGELIDVTPHPNDWPVLRIGKWIWFVPDNSATLEKPAGFHVGVGRPSKFFPLTEDERVHELVRLARRREAEYDLGVSQLLMGGSHG